MQIWSKDQKKKCKFYQKISEKAQVSSQEIAGKNNFCQMIAERI